MPENRHPFTIKTNFMKRLFLFVFVFLSLYSTAQKPFFGKTWLQPPTPVLTTAQKNFIVANPTLTLAPTDTTFFQLKPLAGVAYSFPNYQAQIVAGLSYQHVKYKYQTDKAPAETYIDYAFNLLYSWGKGTAEKELAETNDSSFGAGIGVLNKTLAFNIMFNSYRDPLKPDEKAKLKPVFMVMYSF